MRSLARVPAPLPCAVVLATLLAITGVARPVRTVPLGATVDDRGIDRVVGTVSGPLLATPRGFGAPLHLDRTTVWVWTPARVEPGQRIAVSGRLRTPRGFIGPGSPDRASLTASRGAAWELSATHVELLADEPSWSALAWRSAARMQRELSERLAASAALQGIVAGDRTRIAPEIDARWRAVGIYHVLSVSGLHLAVVAGLAYMLLRKLVAASPLGAHTRPARWAGPAALALALVYTLVTGAQLATLRALLVVTIVIGAQMLDRPVRLVDALGAAAIAILVWRPQDLYDPSFQLSFVAALTLALRPSTADVLGGARTWRRRVVRWVVNAFSASAWIAITTAPITALHFHQVAAGGVLGNLVLTPIIELAALPLGLAGALLGDVGTPLVDVAAWLVERVDEVASLLAHAMPVGAVALGSPILAGLLVTLALWSCRKRQHARVALIAWVLLCGVWALARDAPDEGTLRVTFLDVGQGDAAIVELPGGDVWLVDAGGLPAARDMTTATSTGAAIGRALAVYGHDRIDRAFLSHAHPDHYLGLAALDVPVGELWFADAIEPAADAPPLSFARIAHELAAHGTRLVQPTLGSHTSPGGVVLHVWAPRYAPTVGMPDVLAPDPVRTVNDNSLVLAIEYRGRTILFAGDLEAEGEEAVVAAGLGAVDIVKVAHHGSGTSSSPAFVAATHPELAVISCGVANAFGFPAASVVARWRDAGAAVARTDLDGSVVVTIGAAGALDIVRYRP
jgi:competence protein ComEC